MKFHALVTIGSLTASREIDAESIDEATEKALKATIDILQNLLNTKAKEVRAVIHVTQIKGD